MRYRELLTPRWLPQQQKIPASSLLDALAVPTVYFNVNAKQTSRYKECKELQNRGLAVPSAMARLVVSTFPEFSRRGAKRRQVAQPAA
jgi:hypothetical protein